MPTVFQVFDHLNQRNEKLTCLISGTDKTKPQDAGAEGSAAAADGTKALDGADGKDGDKNADKERKDKENEGEGTSPGELDTEVRELNARLQKENANLHR